MMPPYIRVENSAQVKQITDRLEQLGAETDVIMIFDLEAGQINRIDRRVFRISIKNWNSLNEHSRTLIQLLV